MKSVYWTQNFQKTEEICLVQEKKNHTDNSERSYEKIANNKSKSLLVTRSSPFSTVKSSLPSSSDSPASSSISSKRKSTLRFYLSSSSESEHLSCTDNDTIILSDDSSAEVTQPLNQDTSKLPALKRTSQMPPTASVSEDQYFH